MVPPEMLLTVQPWCVHTAVNALNEPACGCVITIFLPSMILPPPSGMSVVLARAAASPGVAVLPVAGPPVAGPPVAGGPVSPPLLASYVVHPASIAAQVTPAPASSARRLCSSRPLRGNWQS